MTAPPRAPGRPAVIVIMGPSGAGKTTVGHALAVSLGWNFVEADELHRPDSIEKMRRGDGLTDADRRPWLHDVRAAISDAVAHDEPTVVACSALKQQYRELLAFGGGDVRFVYLRADAEILARRLASRTGHFAGPSLASTQLSDLEEPGAEALTLDASAPTDRILTEIRQAFAL